MEIFNSFNVEKVVIPGQESEESSTMYYNLGCFPDLRSYPRRATTNMTAAIANFFAHVTPISTAGEYFN